MAKRYLRSCSTSLAIREIQIQTTLRYQITPVRMANIKNTNDSLTWERCGVKGALIHCWWECKLVQPLWKSVWWLLRKLGIKQPQDPVIPLLWLYPRNVLSYYKSISSTVFRAPLFVRARTWKQPRCPSMEEWIKKLWDIYTLEYYSAVKNKDILNSAYKWMEIENTILSEITQNQKDEYAM